MGYDCDICQGREKIRLPIHRRAMAFSVEPNALTMEESSREYPCPECTDAVRLERVQAASHETMVASYINEPGFIDHIQRRLAHEIASFLLSHDYIKFERGPEDKDNMTFAMRASLGVVRPNQLDNLEERISERQTEVANEAISEAIRRIDNWGSHYGHREISKEVAAVQAREALGAVLKKRSNWKVVT